jgi:hypothetical protein
MPDIGFFSSADLGNVTGTVSRVIKIAAIILLSLGLHQAAAIVSGPVTVPITITSGVPGALLTDSGGNLLMDNTSTVLLTSP